MVNNKCQFDVVKQSHLSNGKSPFENTIFENRFNYQNSILILNQLPYSRLFQTISLYQLCCSQTQASNLSNNNAAIRCGFEAKTFPGHPPVNRQQNSPVWRLVEYQIGIDTLRKVSQRVVRGVKLGTTLEYLLVEPLALDLADRMKGRMASCGLASNPSTMLLDSLAVAGELKSSPKQGDYQRTTLF